MNFENDTCERQLGNPRKQPMTEPSTAVTQTERRELTLAEKAVCDAALEAYRARRTPFAVRITKASDPGKLSFAADFEAAENDGSHALRRLDAFGTVSLDFSSQMIGRLAAIANERGEEFPTETALNAALAAVDAVRPENETEAMLAAQMYATHEVAMEMLTRTKQATNPQALQNYSTIATKLLRTYTAQIEALAKLRRGGEQTVRVEHVHVHEGGQAIVGNVAHQGAGTGGGRQKGQTTP